MSLEFENPIVRVGWERGQRFDVYYSLKRGLNVNRAKYKEVPDMGRLYELRVHNTWAYTREWGSHYVSGGWNTNAWEPTELPLKPERNTGANGASPALPPEVWIDKATRSGVDFASITRLIAEGSRHGKTN